MSTDGTIANLMDMDHLKANVDLQARTYNLGMVTAMLDPSLTQEIRIPSGISINGNVKVDGTKYATRLALTEGKGSMKVDATVDARTRKDGSLDMNSLAYQAKLQASNIQARHFLPHQDLYTFTGTVEAKGVGTDFLSPRTRLMAKAKVNQVHYDKYHLHDVLADAQVANGKIHATLDSKNDLLNGVIAVSAWQVPRSCRLLWWLMCAMQTCISYR